MSHHSSKKPRLTSDSDRLPDDAVFDLLNRLPVKSIVRFRCVSKSWNSVVTDPIFIATNFKLNLSLSNSLSANNNGYLLYVTHADPNDILSALELVTVVCNNDHTVAEVSRFNMPFTEGRMFGFCNGILYLDSYSPLFPMSHSYLWNTSIGKYVMFDCHCSSDPHLRVAIGFAYHSQRHDFKFVRILCFKGVLGAKPAPAMAEVFTLSTGSYKQLVVSVDSLTRIEPNGSISDIDDEDPFLFFNGALHSLAYTTEGDKFILSFDFNDERFREIILPSDYLDDLDVLDLEHLAVFKGLLALIAFGKNELDEAICLIWEMKEYGDVKSWTKKFVFEMENVNRFFGCTRNGDLLIETNEGDLFSFDPENQEGYDLGIEDPLRVAYTTNIMESLVFCRFGITCHQD
uniref:F-box domain-containing protein n=1 Tax=Fagus sylvatica TaxID=28930 RepID=A0A2N9IZI3_FAGSY